VKDRTAKAYRRDAAIVGAAALLIVAGAIYGFLYHRPTSFIAWVALVVGATLGLLFGGRLLYAAVTGRVPEWLRKGFDEYA
jgi:hypothetical protein